MIQSTTEAGTRDVMQVCRNGHVITDLLNSYPDRGLFHCDRCGAQTVDRCATCGEPIPGAIYVPGLPPAGSCPAPNYCASCGAAFPWTTRPRQPPPSPRIHLETILRRLPRIAGQLRFRQTDRPPFRVQDERDLEDLVRALLALHFDDVRPECRTPAYAAGTRTDFLLFPHRIALTTKLAGPELRESAIARQLHDDALYYADRKQCDLLIACVYDPEGLLRDAPVLEKAWSSRETEIEVQCIIAAP
jgi:predicted RNA-binding Zn-ribbon protein involved in translation (DUF1610 family)